MKGVTMSVGTPVTVAVILYLGTMVEATYLERPLWVADKGRQQPVAYVNEDSRFGQFPAANEQAWMIPEPYAPQRTGPSNTEWVEDQPRQSPNAPQTPEPEYYNPYVQPGWNRDPKPENSQSNYYQPEHQTQDKYQPNKMDSYKPKPDADKQLSSNQPKPETFKPNQANVEPFPSNTETMKPNYTPKRPQEVPQSYIPYPARPELYKPGPSFVEPEYQMPHYGQQALPGYTDLEMQVSTNKRPKPQTSNPVGQPNKVRKPQPDNELGQAPLLNSGYNPYQSQESWLPYQQNPTEGLQVPSVPDVNVGDSMSVYQMPSLQGSYGREPIVEKPKPVDRVTQQQENRKPLQPPKIEQQPNRPMQQAPEQPSYQPNRMPSTTWNTQYMPKPVPEMPKPKPQPRPPMVEPTYNRRPEVYYRGNDDEDDAAVVKYAQSITRVDNRCPLEDNPAKPVHFPSLTSCVKFQKCFNGVAYEMSCPGGLEFDAKNNRCDYPARARCSV
uniref:Chitin-binding type-2 domain-containing protein n=1 Tax=Anopheles culicifacies TaxID=139723 RepID=A0A182LY22_9DIPT